MNNYYQYSPYMANQNPYLYGQNQPSTIPFNQPQYQQPTLNGKIVDGLESAKNQEVPIGSTYIFPQANGEYIYSKGWADNGTTFINKYKLLTEDVSEDTTINWNERFDEIYESISDLSKKIDKIKSPTTSTTKRRKVGDDDE